MGSFAYVCFYDTFAPFMILLFSKRHEYSPQFIFSHYNSSLEINANSICKMYNMLHKINVDHFSNLKNFHGHTYKCRHTESELETKKKKFKTTIHLRMIKRDRVASAHTNGGLDKCIKNVSHNP